jgi:hypothetical protein
VGQGVEEILLPKFEYYLDESDPDVVLLRGQDDSFVAAFSPEGVTKEGIMKLPRKTIEPCLKLTQALCRWELSKNRVLKVGRQMLFTEVPGRRVFSEVSPVRP